MAVYLFEPDSLCLLACHEGLVVVDHLQLEASGAYAVEFLDSKQVEASQSCDQVVL